MRRKMPQRMEFTGGSREESASKASLVNAKTGEFGKKIHRYARERKVLIMRPRESISGHHGAILQKLQRYFGHIRVTYTCPNCRSRTVPGYPHAGCPGCGKSVDPVKRYRYRGLGYVDLEHAYLAKCGNVSTFYTSDTSFKSLNQDEHFQPIKFTIIPHPSRIQS